MDDQSQDGGSRQQLGDIQPVRSRWTPRPEQILILETIFNGGMVNPPKDETARIRKLLEKFGPVADANVFYWFQNRRSRSRRRQRQIQATRSAAAPPQPPPRGEPIPRDNFVATAYVLNSSTHPMNTGPSIAGPSPTATPSSSSCSLCLHGNDHAHNSGGLLSLSGPSGLVQQVEQNPVFCSPVSTNFPYQSEMITVYINGVATAVGKGAVDIRAMFGEDFMLLHSTGVPVQLNEYGFLVQGLHHGESYFLVPRIS